MNRNVLNQMKKEKLNEKEIREAFEKGIPLQWMDPHGEWHDSKTSVEAAVYNTNGGSARYRYKPESND